MKVNRVVLNTKLLSYSIKVDRKVSNRVRWWGYKDTECLSIVVYNLISCLRKGQLLVYSRDTGKRSTNKKGITAKRVIKAVDFLEERGYIINNIGTPSRLKEFRSISYLRPTQRFLDEWCCAETRLKSEVDYLEQVEVIEMRDEDKQVIPYRNDSHIRRMEGAVRKLNSKNESHVIKDKDGQILTNVYCRIFNENINLGGRFYRADVLAIKNKGTNDRLRITIDNNPVCEVDYSNLHFRIAAAMEGVSMEDMPLDVYSGLLDDEDNVVDREVVKFAVNILFNSQDEGSARKAVQQKVNMLSKEDKSKYTLGNARSVIALIKEAYHEFEHLFCDNQMYGRILQNADSHLASDVIEKMLEKGVPCLPIHDSFIVPLEHLNLLCDTMGDCFRERFDWDSIVPVGLRYLNGEEVVSEKICV